MLHYRLAVSRQLSWQQERWVAPPFGLSIHADTSAKQLHVHTAPETLHRCLSLTVWSVIQNKIKFIDSSSPFPSYESHEECNEFFYAVLWVELFSAWAITPEHRSTTSVRPYVRP